MAIVMLTRAILFQISRKTSTRGLYGHKKMVCLEQNISIGSIEMTTKASNMHDQNKLK